MCRSACPAAFARPSRYAAKRFSCGPGADKRDPTKQYYTKLFVYNTVLLVSCPRNRTRLRAETMADREVRTWSFGQEVGPPSNVTIRVKVVTNPGRFFASAFGQAVPRRGLRP